MLHIPNLLAQQHPHLYKQSASTSTCTLDFVAPTACIMQEAGAAKFVQIYADKTR